MVTNQVKERSESSDVQARSAMSFGAAEEPSEFSFNGGESRKPAIVPVEESSQASILEIREECSGFVPLSREESHHRPFYT